MDKGRLFVDPASISSGWAFFKGPQLVSHGTIATEKKWSIFTRLHDIWQQYRQLTLKGTVDEVHLELLPRTCHIFTHYSVAIIGHALHPNVPYDSIKGDIPVKSWQKHAGWDSIKDTWKAKGCKSEDELAAIMMGHYYIEKELT